MSSRARAGIVLLCLLGIATNLAILGPALRTTARGVTDFMPLYAGGKLVFTGHLYSIPDVLATEARAEGWSSLTRLYVRLPCFALFYWALAKVPYPVASAVWEVLCVLSAIGFVLLWPSRYRWAVALAGCWSLPLWMTIAEGQDIGFVLLAIAGTAVLLRRRRQVAAGVVASLCIVKFHLFLLIPVWIVARRQWRLAAGLSAGGAALATMSFIAGGIRWPVDYWRLLRRPITNPYAEVMPNLHALFNGMSHAEFLEIAGTVILAVAVWNASRRPNPAWGAAAALTGGILVAPHAYMADAALLLPALLPLISVARFRAVSSFLLCPVLWVLLMTGIGLPVRLGLIGLVFSMACSNDCLAVSGNRLINVPVLAQNYPGS